MSHTSSTSYGHPSNAKSIENNNNIIVDDNYYIANTNSIYLNYGTACIYHLLGLTTLVSVWQAN